MANVTTEFAYPCTRGTQKVGKILSERMISTLIKLVEPERACRITSTSNISDPYEAYLLDGYFFSNPTDMGIGWDVLWFYTSYSENPEQEDFFPELYVDDNGYCLFGGIDGSAPGEDGDAVSINGVQYLLHLFAIADIKSFDEVRCPYYIAEESDDRKKHKIWIKEETMNPYVYVSGDWVPLGAVYKQTPSA